MTKNNDFKKFESNGAPFLMTWLEEMRKEELDYNVPSRYIGLHIIMQYYDEVLADCDEAEIRRKEAYAKGNGKKCGGLMKCLDEDRLVVDNNGRIINKNGEDVGVFAKGNDFWKLIASKEDVYALAHPIPDEACLIYGKKGYTLHILECRYQNDDSATPNPTICNFYKSLYDEIARLLPMKPKVKCWLSLSKTITEKENETKKSLIEYLKGIGWNMVYDTIELRDI